MEQQYGICRVAAAPLRAEPSDRAEMCSQLLFGEYVEVLEKIANWRRIRNAADDYEGWMDVKQLTPISFEQYTDQRECTYYVPFAVHNVIVAADDSRYYLTPGSNLPQYQDGFCYLNDQKYAVLFPPHHTDTTFSGILPAALFFQNMPYLWGGKTMFGLDCSGFVQIVFKLNGIKIKRDAAQQAEEGILVGFLPEVCAGDLAFFDNEEGRIIHVGIMISPNKIIHASGKVRIDPIDDQGIYNSELGRYTHKLRIIKRYTSKPSPVGRHQ